MREETECTCGSGMHPRRCLKHPQGYDLHVLQLNYEGAQETIAELLLENTAKDQQITAMSDINHKALAEVTRRMDEAAELRAALKLCHRYLMGIPSLGGLRACIESCEALLSPSSPQTAMGEHK